MNGYGKLYDLIYRAGEKSTSPVFRATVESTDPVTVTTEGARFTAALLKHIAALEAGDSVLCCLCDDAVYILAVIGDGRQEAEA